MDYFILKVYVILHKENIDSAANMYAIAYEGTDMTDEEIWEECVCDSLGDMNIFIGEAKARIAFDNILPEIKAAVESERKNPGETRGPPEGKTSRETSDKYSRELDFQGRGYDGHSMSVNARIAYRNGEMPLSKWKKSNILEAIEEIAFDEDIPYLNDNFNKLTLDELRGNFLKITSWHHTGRFYNQTDFYSINEEAVKYALTNGTENIISERKPKQAKTSAEKQAEIDNKKALTKAYDIDRKLELIFISGVSGLKTKRGLVKRYLDGNLDLSTMYYSAIDAIHKKDGTRIDSWKKLPDGHWRKEDVKLYLADKEGYVINEYLSYYNPHSNTNIQKIKNKLLKENVSQVKTSRETAYSQEITIQNVEALREILKAHNISGTERLSINQFTSEDIKKAEPWARKFYAELGTKSPFFRAWFGDWRAYDRSKIKTVTVENIDLSDVIMQNGEYTNPDTGWSIYAGKTLREETRHYARGEKVSVKVLNDVKNILENAVLLDTEISNPDSKNKKPGTAFMHKLYAPITYKGKSYIAKLTIEEYLDTGSNDVKRKGYHLAAIKIEAADGHFTDESANMSRSNTTSINSISDLFEFVKTYDKDFKPKPVNEALLNEDGTPKVFYHGTFENWTAYDLTKNVNQQFGEGIYLTESKERARLYGDNIMPFYVRAMYDYRSAKKNGTTKDYSITKNGDLIVYSPEQIKSATDNIGTFDGGNADINYSRELDFIDYLNENADVENVYEAENLTLDEMSARAEASLKEKKKEYENVRKWAITATNSDTLGGKVALDSLDQDIVHYEPVLYPAEASTARVQV